MGMYLQVGGGYGYGGEHRHCHLPPGGKQTRAHTSRWDTGMGTYFQVAGDRGMEAGTDTYLQVGGGHRYGGGHGHVPPGGRRVNDP